MKVELPLYMQIATNDVYRQPNIPVVHLYCEDEEFGLMTFDGEVLDGDLEKGEFLNYIRQEILKKYDELLEQWNTLLKEVG